MKLSNGKKLSEIRSLEDLQELRNDTFSEMGKLRDSFNSRGDEEKGQPGSWADDEENRWKRCNDEFDAITKRMEEIRKSESISDTFQRADELMRAANGGRGTNNRDISSPGDDSPEITPEIRDLAFQGWCCRQLGGDLSERHEEAMSLVKIAHRDQLKFSGFNTREIRELQQTARSHNRANHRAEFQKLVEERAMGSTATNGLEFIPEGFIQAVEINQLAYSGVMQAGDILRTASGNDLPWPTIDDTSNKGVLLAESGAVATDTDPSTSSVTMKAYKFTSKTVLVPYELLEDADLAPELPTILSQLLGERLGRIKEQYYTTGTGSSQPQGVVTASAAGVTAASATAIASDEVIKLEHAVDPAYRSNAAYMMHDSVLLAVRLLKDNDGQYLWQPGLRNGVPDRLNGRMVYINQEMEGTIATGNDVMLFGDFTKMKLREVNQIRMYRLVERYRDNDQDGFVAFCRGDSRLLNAGTNPIKKLTMA